MAGIAPGSRLFETPLLRPRLVLGGRFPSAHEPTIANKERVAQ